MSVHVDFIGSSDPFFPVSKLPEPISERAVSIRKKMGPERWQREVVKARERLCIVRRVKRLHAHGYGSWTACLKRVAPGVHRSTYLNWRRLVGIVEGPAWERLLDARIPQPCQPIALEIRSAAESLRRADPQIRYEMARECLIEQFGSAGMVSDASLGRIWRKAGLANIEAGDAGRFERVCDCPGGAVLAILGAAAAESGVPEALANAALQAGKAFAESQEAGKPGDPYTGRDENGHFTAAYNQSVRQGLEAGQADSRWDSDQVKRERRELRSLSVLSLSPETLAQRLLVMGMLPLVSNLRGFDAAETPRAKWLRLLGWPAYEPATLDKTLRELALLAVDTPMWKEHEKQWVVTARQWSGNGPHWKPLVRFMDITSEPHYTGKFAKSGKVSRVGRVMPCLHRVSLTVNPGVTLWMRTFSGAQSLRKHLRDMLAEQYPEKKSAKVEPERKLADDDTEKKPAKVEPERKLADDDTEKKPAQVEPERKLADDDKTAAATAKPQSSNEKKVKPEPTKAPEKRPQAGGTDHLWVTVVDAEAATAGMLWDLSQIPNHSFISILKGHILKGAKILEVGSWLPYRERDQIRAVRLVVSGKDAPAGGVEMRAVEMTRKDSRHPHSTMFVTDAAPDFLATTEVADADLSRWPNQEQVFRRARHSVGMERSQGYTGEYVPHSTLDEKLEEAQRQVERTRNEVDSAQMRSLQAQETKKKAKGTELALLASQNVKNTAQQFKHAEAQHEAAVAEEKRLATMPKKIFQRDTTRENIVTATTMTILSLITWVLREYFGGLRMEPSTFLEYFLNLRVETHTTWFRTLYRIDISDLPADKANLLRQACEEITARRIRRYGRWLKFEVADLSKSRTWLKFIPKNIEEAELSKSRDGTHS